MDSVNKLVVPFPRINFNMKNRFSYSSYDKIFQGGGGGGGGGAGEGGQWCRRMGKNLFQDYYCDQIWFLFLLIS